MSVETANAAPCGSFQLHRAHIYRTGWLWLDKNECSGSPWAECRVELSDDFEPPHAGLVLSKTIAQLNESLGFSEGLEPEDKEEDEDIDLPHIHLYRLQKAFHFGPKRDSDLVWYCECRNYFVSDRDLWWKGGVQYDVK